MDDRNFDEKSAREWIATIESEKAKTRGVDLYPLLAAWIEQVEAHEILEIGAGQGACSDKIDLTGRHYTGVEPSPVLLERARQLYAVANRRFVAGSAYALPFNDAIFDAAYSIAVWHLLKDLAKATSELARVVKANGKFLIVTANPEAASVWTCFKDDVVYLHSLEAIERAALDAGLVIESVMPFPTVNGAPGRFVSFQGVKPG